MNILFVLHSYPKIGGIEMVTKTISQYLCKSHNLYYLARIADTSVMRQQENCYYFPSRNKKECISFYNDLVRRLNIDIVVNQGPFLPFNPILGNAERAKGVKIYSFVHFAPGFEFERAKYIWMTEHHPLKRIVKRIKTALRLNTLQYNPDKMRRKYRQLYDISSQIVVLSAAYIDTFRRSYRLKEWSRIVSLPNPTRYSCDDESCVASKTNTILFVGRLELESKRVDRLLSAWHAVEDKGDWRLKIVGDGPHRCELERITEELNIQSVEFLGEQSDIAPFYREADVIALTSTYEGQSLCFIEGIQFGAIPIAFDVSEGNRKLVCAISNDLLITPFSTESYAAQLSRIMQNVEYRHSLHARSKAAANSYTLESVGSEWDKLFAGE